MHTIKLNVYKYRYSDCEILFGFRGDMSMFVDWVLCDDLQLVPRLTDEEIKTMDAMLDNWREQKWKNSTSLTS